MISEQIQKDRNDYRTLSHNQNPLITPHSPSSRIIVSSTEAHGSAFIQYANEAAHAYSPHQESKVANGNGTHLHGVERVEGAGRGRSYTQVLVPLEFVREQTVGGAVVIVRIGVQRLRGETQPRECSRRTHLNGGVCVCVCVCVCVSPVRSAHGRSPSLT